MGDWRKIETAAPEGASSDHTAYEYQFGGEIDGVFVPAVTKSGGYIDALVSAGKQAQENEQPTSSSNAEQPNGGQGGEQSAGSSGDGGQGGGQPAGEGGAA